ncbi:hypothetical protein BH11VER1_BH11VER1_26230 [soil metagenome]
MECKVSLALFIPKISLESDIHLLLKTAFNRILKLSRIAYRNAYCTRLQAVRFWRA